MDQIPFLNNIASIAVSISLLLALFLLTVKTTNKLANRLFACFLILNAIDVMGFSSYSFLGDSLNLETFRMSLFLLAMPVFYLYVLAVCYTDFRLEARHLLHATPFVLLNLALAPRLYLAGNIEKQWFVAHLQHTPEMYFSHILGEAQYAFYIIAVLRILTKYKTLYLENYANPNRSSYQWLFQMTMVFLAAHSFVFFRNVLRFTDYSRLFLWVNVVIGIAVLLITCWFVLKALNSPELFRGIDSKLELSKDIHKPQPEATGSQPQNPTDESTVSQIALLKTYMVEEQPYLDPSLTIQELANRIEMPVRELSVLINHHMDQHFFDFVNEFRILKAMEILKDQSKSQLTILEILYEVGFNSKSSFNTSFKKYTSLTPTDFRNSSL
ncbi:helix-turn-helix domain-containing protein [Flavobacterium humi]|uniref:AraC family transcriptional regulator n=1 Tax=Flavobacterium humi TaxID=2562683 RepID=A0A4Z0L6V1_9FLAO|nr:AraC family transcriptional regulator [Flavobacterium humi]TGD58117.1 AraC family transcriptional regulator [Flavobacterium humi]